MRNRGLIFGFLAALLATGCSGFNSGNRLEPVVSMPHGADALPPAIPAFQEPEPPAVSTAEIYRQILSLYPRGLRPLRIRGRLQVLLHDLDGDGYPEGFGLGVSALEVGEQEMAGLGEYSRVFQENKKEVPFNLLLFSNHGGSVRLERSVDLGRWKGFDSLRKAPLVRNQSSPLLLVISFPIPEGDEQQLFAVRGPPPVISHYLSLKQSLVRSYYLEDIDDNQVLDLIVRERGMEEGTGQETFLTWFRWDGIRFREHRNTNVVRNLKVFLAHVRERLLARDFSDLLSDTANPETVRALRRRMSSDAELFAALLGMSLQGALFPKVREVIFPEILEDPFTYPTSRDFSFRLSLKIVDLDGVSFIAEPLIQMSRNPFQSRQFQFALP